MNVYKLISVTDKRGKQSPKQREAEKVLKDQAVILRTKENYLYVFSLSAMRSEDPEAGATAPLLFSTSRIVEKTTTYGDTIKLKVETRNSLYYFERVAKL